MLYQCIGISGAILLFYGMLTTAFTSISEDWFVRGLWIAGFVGLAVFVIKSLDRIWQRVVLYFVLCNASWILFAMGQDWSSIAYAGPITLVFCLFVYLRKGKFDISTFLFIAVTGSLVGLFFLSENETLVGTSSLIGAILLNVSAFLSSKNELLIASQDETKFTKNAINYVYAVIVFITFVVINILSQDFNYQWDVTANKLNSLSKQSIKVLDNLEDTLSIRIFLKKANEKKSYAKMITKFYEDNSKNIKVSFIDPDVEKLLSEKYQAKDGDIVVSYKNQKYTTQNLSEEGITQAILKVTGSGSAHLCFLSGHGELELDGADDSVRSLSSLQKGLENEGYTYDAITGITDSIDPRCEIFIVAGPQQSIPSHEAQAIDQFLEGGGKAIFLVDPIFSNPNLGEKQIMLKATGLEKVLFHWGVELGRNLLLQKTIAMFEGEQIVSQITGFQYGNHPIVDPLKGKQTLFDGVQSVHLRPDFEGTTYKLIESFGQGATWTKTNMKELLVDQNAKPGSQDLAGPVPFVVASEKEGDSKTQILVAGDADFISNEMIITNEYNYDLFLNMLGWLSGVEEKISIRPKLFKTSAIELSPTQSKTIFYVAVIFLPMLVLLFGINLWWIRRNRG